MLLYSSEPERLRALLGEAFGLGSVDAGHGWLIFTLPPAEIAVHPEEPASDGRHQVTFMCTEIRDTIAGLRKKGVEFEGEPHEERFGVVAMMKLPGGVKVMLYEPRHPIAITP
jgi:hypothetical protein